MKKTLILFYSLSGNTEKIANKIRDELDADIEKIETVQPYEGSYDDIVEQGQLEVERLLLPEIKELEHDVRDYDVVIVGTPTWWYTMAPAVRTMLSNTQWSGKTIVPFQTHVGWPGHTIKDIKSLCAGATFKCEKKIKYSSEELSALVTSESEIEDWIEELKKI